MDKNPYLFNYLKEKETKMKKLNKKGFTLAELLIVVAIIAVLVAISIPVFSSQLEKSREAVDAANIRAKYAELMTSVVTGDYKTTDSYEVELTQQTANWQTADLKTSLGKLGTLDGEPAKGGKATLTYNTETSVLTIKFA